MQLLPLCHGPRARFLASLIFSLTLAACGGNSDTPSRLDNIGDGGDGSTDTPGGDDSNDPAQLGRGSADNFVAGEIEVGIGDSALSPGGDTSLSVTLVNGEGELVTSAVNVTFNSECIADGSSQLIGTDTEGGNSVSTSNGRATVTYRANGCVGDDQVTARATFQGVEAGSARATITVEADAVQTISFVGADPELISLAGTGGQETSRVTFLVRGTTGSPVREADVEFALSPAGTGGTALVNTTGTSNGDGEVSTTVQAGTVATSVRVTASVETDVGTISTQSSQLVISTGIPDQNSMSLSASDLHPVAWNFDGVESQLTIRLADAFNNPAPDGTAVTFTTSGGAVDSSCTTSNGACSVTWRSQSPRPEPSQGFIVTESPLGVSCPDGPVGSVPNCRPGRVKILATALGNESFIDTNSNGVFNHDADVFADDNSEGQCDPNRPQPYAEADEDGCDDLGTAYLDKNFSGTRDSNEEIVALSPDENSDGSQFEPGDGIYNGVLCSQESEDAGECNDDTVIIRDDMLIVMVCAEPFVMGDGQLPGHRNVELAPGESDTVTMLLADCNGNGMPAGTTLQLNDEQAQNVETSVFPDGALAGSAEPSIISISITADENPENSAGGVVHLSVSAPTPGGELVSRPASVEITAAP